MIHVDYLSRYGSVNPEELPIEEEEDVPANINQLNHGNNTDANKEKHTMNDIRYGDIETINWKEAQEEDEDLKIVRQWITSGVFPTKQQQNVGI